jgi:hypothetical protein
LEVSLGSTVLAYLGFHGFLMDGLWFYLQFGEAKKLYFLSMLWGTCIYLSSVGIFWLTSLFIHEIVMSLHSGEVSRVSPQDSDYSWNVLALDNNNILAGKPKFLQVYRRLSYSHLLSFPIYEPSHYIFSFKQPCYTASNVLWIWSFSHWQVMPLGLAGNPISISKAIW